MSEKGALSVYGLGRFPVTLYREQWEKLLGMSEEIRNFIQENDGALKKKSSEDERCPRAGFARNSYELREYEVDPDDLAAETVAAKIGLPAEQVFKTLVMRGDRNGVCLAVVPGNAEVHEKALARLTGDRKMEMVPLKEVQGLTGYIRGGVTALAAKRDFPVYVDETAELFDQISISAGVRGTQILIAPGDYLRAVKATVGEIAREKQ